MPPEEITTLEAAEILRISQRTVRRIIANGGLQARIVNPTSKRLTFRLDRKQVEALKRKMQTGPLKLPS